MVERIEQVEVGDAGRLYALFRQCRREISNWWWVLPLAAVCVPCRIPPKRGLPKLGRRAVNVRLRTGVNIRCRLNEVYFLLEVFAMEVYDAPEIRWQRLRTIVDIGANIGAASIWFTQRASGASVLAVEPARDTNERLRSNLARNELIGKVDVVRLAVGADSGAGYLVSGENSGVARTLTAPVAGAEVVEFAGLERVVAMAGGTVDLMKVDCEGGEYGFLTGAPLEVLGRIGAIIGEYHLADEREQSRLFEHLESSGFRCRVMPDGIHGGLELGTFVAWHENWESSAD